MKTHLAAGDLPYWLWGAVLALCACLYALAPLAFPHADRPVVYTAPGFTVPEPHVGQVRVIPQANAALVSPCAAQDGLLAVGEQALAEL